jgi:hypothetical protein
VRHQKLAHCYQGVVVRQYNNIRSGKPKWQRERKTVRQYLDHLPDGASIIDVPAGTGRFFDLYAVSGCSVTGVDISRDMLDEAARHESASRFDLRLSQGSIFDLQYPDDAFDASSILGSWEWEYMQYIEWNLPYISENTYVRSMKRWPYLATIWNQIIDGRLPEFVAFMEENIISQLE